MCTAQIQPPLSSLFSQYPEYLKILFLFFNHTYECLAHLSVVPAESRGFRSVGAGNLRSWKVAGSGVLASNPTSLQE